MHTWTRQDERVGVWSTDGAVGEGSTDELLHNEVVHHGGVNAVLIDVYGRNTGGYGESRNERLPDILTRRSQSDVAAAGVGIGA